MGNYNEAIAFVVARTGWTLEYIGNLEYIQFFALVEELQYQQRVENYNASLNAASIVATLATIHGKRRHQANEVAGNPPERKMKLSKKSISKPVVLESIKLSDGVVYRMAKFTMNMMIEVEGKFEKTFPTLMQDPSMKVIRYVLYLRLQGEYPQLSETSLGEIIDTEVMLELGKILGMA